MNEFSIWVARVRLSDTFDVLALIMSHSRVYDEVFELIYYITHSRVVWSIQCFFFIIFRPLFRSKHFVFIFRSFPVGRSVSRLSSPNLHS